jgi:hypothetical protein
MVDLKAWRYRQTDNGRRVRREGVKRYLRTPHGRAMRRNLDYKRRYGITIADKERMYEEQKGLCAMCREPLPPVHDRNTHTDHCHVTRKVRGLTHQRCNVLLGHLEGKTHLLEKAFQYLGWPWRSH